MRSKMVEGAPASTFYFRGRRSLAVRRVELSPHFRGKSFAESGAPSTALLRSAVPLPRSATRVPDKRRNAMLKRSGRKHRNPHRWLRVN